MSTFADMFYSPRTPNFTPRPSPFRNSG